MKICKLMINNFRGVKNAELFLPDNVVLIGDNNVGKSTVFEALDLVLGPERLNRRPIIDEHDFYLGEYQSRDEEDAPEIYIEATITNLNQEQQSHFIDYIEWWDIEKSELHVSPPPGTVDSDNIIPAMRVSFSGSYDEEEDDFVGQTYFPKSDEDGERKDFRKKDKQICGFLYLRSLRTGSRALSLERGSLLDIILRIKEIRPQMWEKTINVIAEHEVASDPEVGISGILESIEKSIKKYVPKEWGVSPHLKVSNLTREHLRKVITSFIATGEGDHAAPFYRQGTGTINLLVLAMLSQIAQDKQNIVFAMEEPETAIPPYAQKRIVHEVRKLSTQSLFTSHSPYVIEEFDLEETVILTRQTDGNLIQSSVTLPGSIKQRRYKREFRTRFCEGLLSRRILLAEGATETSAFPTVALRLSEIDSDKYSPLEALGICTIDAGSDSQISDLANLYRQLGKQVYALCDKQDAPSEAKIKTSVDELYMHSESGLEKLVLNNTTQAAMDRYLDEINWPSDLQSKFPNPKSDAKNALFEYFKRSKGGGVVAEFLYMCEENEIPDWIRKTCIKLKSICEPDNEEEKGEEEDSEEDISDID